MLWPSLLQAPICPALRADKTVVAWPGDGYGQTNVPDGLTNVIAIAGGLDHSVALRGNGTVVAWGDTNFDELDIPPGLSNVVAISAGWDQTSALQANGMVVGWGSDGWVPAGISNFVAASADWDTGKEFLQNDGTMIPNVSGFTSLTALASGHFFVLAIKVPARPENVLAVPVTNPTWESGQFSVSAPTRYGKVYMLEYRNALTDTNCTSWPLVAGNGEARVIHDATAIEPQRFYQLLEW